MSEEKKQRKNANNEDLRQMDKLTVFLKDLELVSIELIESSLKKTEKFNPPAVISIKSESSYKTLKNKKESFAVYYKFVLMGRQKGKKKDGITVSAHYKVIFKNTQKLNDEIFNDFFQFQLDVIVWPYFRQFVQEMISKANLPPLTLDFFRAFQKSKLT
jgi:preprotein translocase subunit SecB